MTQRELSLWLESMGFSKESVSECLQKLQFRGNKTIVDANQLIEQLLHAAPRVAQINPSPLRRSNRLRNSRSPSPITTTQLNSTIPPTATSASTLTPSNISPFISNVSPFPASPIASIKPIASPALANSPYNGSMQCKICFERQIDTVILRCGHVCVCSKCTPQLKLCPICRQGTPNFLLSNLRLSY